jgi:hypothetical protein
VQAALDIDWDDPAVQAAALARLLGEVERMEQRVATQSPTQTTPALQETLTVLRAVLTQDLEPDPTTGGHRSARPGQGPTAFARRSADAAWPQTLARLEPAA